jgi:hypothetical protein
MRDTSQSSQIIELRVFLGHRRDQNQVEPAEKSKMNRAHRQSTKEEKGTERVS